MGRQIGKLFAIVVVAMVALLAVSATANASGGNPGPCSGPAGDMAGSDYHSPCAQTAANDSREATGNSDGAIAAAGVVLLMLAVTSGLFIATRRREVRGRAARSASPLVATTTHNSKGA